MSFLKAEWRKLAIANYAVKPELLTRYLPANTELDLWNGTCYISLVGFMFTNVKMLNLPIPFHRQFEEVNLRFYVKHFDGKEWKRGVVFIKEIVPKRMITFVANNVYKEHYMTLPMSHQWKINSDRIDVSYTWFKNKSANTFSVSTENIPRDLLENSEAEFITEHYWGYTKINQSATTEYEVKHPRWKIYDVKDYKISVDFGSVYGDEFNFLKDLVPTSVMLAEGSEISVENKRKL